MIEMGVGQQHRIDRGRIELERLGIRAFGLATALEHAAIDQHARSLQVTRWQDPVTCLAAPWQL